MNESKIQFKVRVKDSISGNVYDCPMITFNGETIKNAIIMGKAPSKQDYATNWGRRAPVNQLSADRIEAIYLYTGEHDEDGQKIYKEL